MRDAEAVPQPLMGDFHWGKYLRICGRGPDRQHREAVEQEYRLGNRKSC